MLKDLLLKSRSCRRFHEDVRVEDKTLRELVDFTRLTPSAANLQPLKYIISFDRQKNSLIFPHLAWAGYLKDWPGPKEGERPAAYIIILGDKEISGNFGCDHGITAHTILLGAVEKGLAGCMIGSIKRDDLREALDIPSRYEILLVLALGQAKERVVVEPLNSQGDIKYWRDTNGVHHVSKRPLAEIILTDI
ncbi:MAG: nitroreductase family protein [Candidatus Omnitrophota bacterium]